MPTSYTVTAAKFADLEAAVRDHFGYLPTDKEAGLFVAQWVAKNHPEDAPAILVVQYLHLYMNVARE